MITLAELESDPKYREMNECDLSVALLCGLLSDKDWVSLPGEESSSKARNLQAKWAAEGKASGDMLCRWVRYTDQKPSEDKEYVVVANGDCLFTWRYDNISGRFTDSEGWKWKDRDIAYWLDGLTFPSQSKGE